VKNPFYSSDDYEKFQKELKKKQEKEYSEFLSKVIYTQIYLLISSVVD
jgi:hypothetical protein